MSDEYIKTKVLDMNTQDLSEEAAAELVEQTLVLKPEDTDIETPEKVFTQTYSYLT